MVFACLGLAERFGPLLLDRVPFLGLGRIDGVVVDDNVWGRSDLCQRRQCGERQSNG